MKKNRRFRAFTLVELLVVISIIALLLAVLMPALSKAREMAKVLTCAANVKQIGTVISTYQAANDGAVPTMLNRFTKSGDPDGPYPARSRLLSVALIAGSREGAALAAKDNGEFDPDKDWGSSTDRKTKPNYFKKYLPKFYICPFVREADAAAQSDYVEGSPVVIKGQTVRTLVRKSKGESFAVWRWELKKGVRPHNYSNDLYTIMGDPYGTPKYGALAWNNYADNGNTKKWSILDNSAVKWSGKQLKRIGAASLSDATIVYCEQGQTDSHVGGTDADNGIYNYGSHKKTGKGGTDVLFADGHVGWVEGTMVGWP
jgi:prepilin-type N-terminal cleavage/methylation domain-containing protein/prepilin-type processing-associated H-X9-DG protein